MAHWTNAFAHTANCCGTSAAATSSARISRILDTAIVAVSVFVWLVSIRLWV